MAKTIADRLCAGLLILGYERPAKRPANRYTMFVDPLGGYIYVGQRGALRRGPNVADSRPMSNVFYNRLMEVANGQG